MKKKLLIIPVAHSEAEMGSLRNDISQIIEGAMGWDRRERHREEVYTFWENLKELLTQILKDVNIELVKVYQDGIPVGGELGVKLVEECARNGSQNFQIISSLLEKGATLEKTEDVQLLKEEYEILKNIINAKTDSEREKLAGRYKKRLHELTEERDKYIAGRIKETLKEGMLGILFIGAAHNILPYLSPEIDAFVCNYVERDIVEWMSK
ncbi:MAG: hypothetical protein QMD22_01170 [archaeon]|nr:hypothetical protein [archaeon]